MSFNFGYIFLALYIGWVLYLAIIKKNLKQHKHDVLGGAFFCGVWLLFYYLLTH